MPALAELSESRELLANLTSRELRGKYKRSVLGWSWSLINPLVTMGIFYVVFGVILGAGKGVEGHPSGLANFALYLAIGLLPWGFLANGMTGSIGSLIANANLVKKVYFRREILVFSAVGAFLVTFLIEMLVLCVVLLVVGNNILPWLPVVIAVIAVQTLFVTGMGLTVSVLNVYFRDTQHFLSIFLQLWFYATPIVYPDKLVKDLDVHTDLVTGKFVPGHHILGFRPITLFRLNPMERFVEAFRDVFYYSRWPEATTLLFCAGSAALSLGVGYWLFSRFEGRLAEEL